MILSYTLPHDLDQLHDELNAAGVPPDRCEGDSATVTLTYPDGVSEPAVAAVVNAHVPRAAAARQAAEANQAALTQKTANAIATIENAADNWPTLTAAQKDSATRLAVRVTARLARIATHTLDIAP
jgi:hypothetical protein